MKNALMMVFLALILMAVAAISIDYFRVRSEKKEKELKVYKSNDLTHLPV